MNKLSKNCVYCGKSFSKPETTSLLTWNKQSKYCSRICYWKDKIKPLSKTCAICGKLFKSKTWNTKAVYCSRTCRIEAQRKPLPTCELCGKPCLKHNRRFCSRACKTEWYRGEEVYNYAGGQARDHYASSFWLNLAEDIRKRDKTCQRCGCSPRPGTKLHVHHIHPWRFSKNDSPENLQALCASCHKKADHELGL